MQRRMKADFGNSLIFQLFPEISLSRFIKTQQFYELVGDENAFNVTSYTQKKNLSP